ncbi:MAG TPA: hypothetical protein ENK18_16170 [Deltaproteobacteria bacterium]|nr:hypothetical protein [Deltaproteobacteria bacterium]
MRLWIAGATQGRSASALARSHAALYTQAVLASLEVGSRPPAVEVVLRHRGRHGLGHAFKGVSRAGDTLLLCTEGEVVVVRGDRILRTETHPWLNDVHHAAQIGDALHVVSTGTDAVIVEGRFLPVIPGVAPPSSDVRSMDLRPHRAHPNHLFVVGGRPHVTRGLLGDAIALHDRATRWALADVVVHDGVVRSDGIWFTAVDGRLICVDPTAGRIVRTVALAPLGHRAPPLGWCRGLAFVDGIAWVGFTRLRATWSRRNLAWARGLLRGRVVASPHPTRLVGYDLGAEAQIGEVLVEEIGLDAIFGLVGPGP